MDFQLDSNQVITRTQLTITLILILFCSITGATYAYFAISATNNNTITGNAATVNLTLNVERVFPTESNTNTGVMVPQLSTSASATSPLANALKSGCVDANQNVVCQVYKITIANIGGTATQVVDGKVSFFGNSAMTKNITTVIPNLSWRLVESVNVTTPASSVLGSRVDNIASSTPYTFVSKLTLATNNSFDYYMIIWVDETNSDQSAEEGQTFYGNFEFSSSNGTGVTSAFSS